MMFFVRWQTFHYSARISNPRASLHDDIHDGLSGRRTANCWQTHQVTPLKITLESSQPSELFGSGLR